MLASLFVHIFRRNVNLWGFRVMKGSEKTVGVAVAHILPDGGRVKRKIVEGRTQGLMG